MTAQERVRRFRLERVARVVAGETPIQMGEGAKVIFHAFPTSARRRSGRTIAWGPKILVVCCPRQENTPRGYAPAPSPATVRRRHQDSARGTRQNRQNPDRERIEIATVALPGVEG